MGLQVLVVFCLIKSYFFVIKELNLRWSDTTFGPFLFVSLLKHNLLNFHVDEHLPISWKFVYSLSEADQGMIHVLDLMCVPQWLHKIKHFRFDLYHLFFCCVLSTSTPHSSLNRQHRKLRWGWYVYWILSRRTFSNEIVITSIIIFFRTPQISIKMLRMKLQITFCF